MKILVIGGAGYLGDGLVDCLIRDGHDVVVYDNLLYSDYWFKPVKFIRGDIRDYNKLENILPEFECCVYLAGLVGDAACSCYPTLTKEINIDAPIWFANNYKGKIIFTSSCSVYGKNEDLLDENSPTDPLSIYAESKLLAEKAILDTHPDALVWRLGTLYGKSGNWSRPRLDLVANILTVRAVQGKILNVYGGEQNRPLLSVLDVGEATSFAIKNNLQGLFVLSSKNYRLSDMAMEIASYVPGAEVKFNDIPFQDARNYKVNTAQIEKTGWKAKYSLKNGVETIKNMIEEDRIKDVDNPLFHNGNFLKSIGGF